MIWFWLIFSAVAAGFCFDMVRKMKAMNFEDWEDKLFFHGVHFTGVAFLLAFFIGIYELLN